MECFAIGTVPLLMLGCSLAGGIFGIGVFFVFGRT